MDSKNKLESLKIAKEKIQYNEPMKKHTTFKIGGKAEYFIKIDNEKELKEVLKFAKQNNQPITVVGNGSNILILDKGIKGITLKIQIEKIEIQEKNGAIQITVGAGEKLGKLAQIAKQKQISRIRRVISVYQEP